MWPRAQGLLVSWRVWHPGGGESDRHVPGCWDTDVWTKMAVGRRKTRKPGCSRDSGRRRDVSRWGVKQGCPGGQAP